MSPLIKRLEAAIAVVKRVLPEASIEHDLLIDVLEDASDTLSEPPATNDVSFLSFEDVLAEVAKRTTACVVGFIMPMETGKSTARTSYRCSGGLVIGIGLSQMLNQSLVRDCLKYTDEEE